MSGILQSLLASFAGLATEGALYVWGRDREGNLGINLYNAYRSSPVQVGALTNWASIAANSDAVSAINANGERYAWGNNAFGMLGDNSYNPPLSRSSPVQVGAETTWEKHSVANYAIFAIKTNGTLWVSGRNSFGLLGLNLGTTEKKSSPTQIGSLTGWDQVDGGQNFAGGIRAGRLYMWGKGTDGTMGDGYAFSRSSPVQVGAGTDWALVACSKRQYNTLAIKTNGTLWGWGRNQFNAPLGLNNLTNYSSPVQVGALTNWASVVTGSNNTVAIKTDNTLWAWGINNKGQLGLNDRNNRSSPVQVGTLTDWEQVSTATNHCVAKKTDGTAWAWGDNTFSGRLGINNQISRSSPVQIGSDTNWLSVTADRYASIGIRP